MGSDRSGLGEGGPPVVDRSGGEPSGGSRPQRAAHIAPSEREIGVVERTAPERAIVRQEQARRARRAELSRRRFFGAAFWGAMGIGLTGGLAAFLSFFWPRGLQGFGGEVPVSADLVPRPGDSPVRVANGKFWLVNLEPGEGTHAGFGTPGSGGLVALYWVCPHLGCTVPWRDSFTFEGGTGWFRCPCHGSTYNRAGVRVYGPAPRPLDTMDIAVNADGSLTVDTGSITPGGEDNPTRAVPYDA